MKRVWLVAAVLSAGFTSVAAQTATISPSPAAAPPPVADSSISPAPAILAADTRVSIELAEAVSSNGRKRGDKFAIRLAAPIVVGGVTVAPAGATGVGEVVYAEAGGGGGSPGKLVLAARYIDVGDARIRLKAFNLGAGGESDFREMQVAAELIGPMVLLINGRDVLYPIGTRARAKVAQDMPLPLLAATAPATPVAVPAPPAAPPSPPMPASVQDPTK